MHSGTAGVQQGQALVLAVAMLVLGSLALMLLSTAGRATATKQRLVNAADAAALSAATWRARILNFDAYSNRAIVANEVAVAQAVTLVSWSRYLETLSDNAATVSRLYPPVTAFFVALHDVAKLARDAAQTAAELEIAVRAASNLGYKDLLQASQEMLHVTGEAFALSMITAEVAAANDEAFFAHLLRGDSFGRFTRRYADDTDRRRLQRVVEASLDPFVGGPRSSNMPVAPSGCLSLDPDRMMNWVRKRGATVLGDDLDRWEAHDTASLHTWRAGRGFLGLGGGCGESEMLALGWGAAEADSTPDGEIHTQVHDTPRNRSARQQASSDAEAFESYGGLARVRELNFGELDDDRFPVSRIAVLARTHMRDGARAGATARPSSSGRLQLHGNYAGNHQWALAAAEVRFQRPASAGRASEYASLYNPYWQARLAEPSAADRALADSYVH